MRKYRPRIYYTEADKALMWERWRLVQATPRSSPVEAFGRKKSGPTPHAMSLPLVRLCALKSDSWQRFYAQFRLSVGAECFW